MNAPRINPLSGAAYGTQDSSRRLKGIVIVVALHVVLGYALISGMARNALTVIKKPLEAVVIQEVTLPPPPPPPPPPPKKMEATKPQPKLEAPPPPFVPPPEVTPAVASTAPAIVSVATPPPAPAVIAPPLPPAPPKPVAIAPARVTIGVACPTQVPPEMPRKALQDGTEGIVKAQVVIRDGVVKEVTILSGPRVFHSAVRSAMLQYKCNVDAGDIVATQEFNFKVE
jgi:protein TonB